MNEQSPEKALTLFFLKKNVNVRLKYQLQNIPRTLTGRGGCIFPKQLEEGITLPPRNHTATGCIQYPGT